MKRAWILNLFLAVSSTAAFADPPATAPDKSSYTLFDPVPADQMRDMETDRPNVTNSPHTIDAGHLQIETGIATYSYYRSFDDPLTAWSFGQANFRLGILNNLELNLAVDPYDLQIAHLDSPGTTQREASFGDTVLGGKINLWGNGVGDRVWGSALAIQPQFKIPTADTDLGNGRFECFVLVPFTVNLPDGFNLSLQPGIFCLRNSTDTGYALGAQGAVAIDRVMWKYFDLYVEYVFSASVDPHTEAGQFFDFGCIYQLTRNVSLDTAIDLGLNKISPVVGATLGVSVRF